MKILITSIVDLKKSQHQTLRKLDQKTLRSKLLEKVGLKMMSLSEKHEVTVLSINDWWKGGQDDLESYSSEFNDIFKRIDYFYLTDKKVSPILQELFFKKKVKEMLKEEDFDVHLNYNTLISRYEAAKRIKTVYDIADDLGAMIKESPQIPRLLRPFGGILGDLMIRKNIERSETLEAGSNIIAGTTSNKILECTNQMFHVNNSWKNPFGDGKAGKRIVEIVEGVQG